MSKCTECKEYDKENHYCPKWCDVIKGTIEDARADERAKVLDLIDTMDFDFGDFYDHTYEIKEMIKTMITKEQNK